MRLWLHEVPSPLGPIDLAAEKGGALAYLGFATAESRSRIPRALERDAADLAEDPKVLEPARRQLEAYFRGELREFRLPLALRGTPFQLRVWAELQKIPYGTTISYLELARRLGDPNATRAVGAANGANPVSIIVPCHRVIGANGSLTGYGGGLENKKKLLELERPAQPPRLFEDD